MELFGGFFEQYGLLLAQATWDTLVMVIVSCAFSYLIGLPIGVGFAVTAPGGLHPVRWLNTVLGWIINIGRSIPFIILLVAIIPFTRLIMGTALGVQGAIVPLVVSAAPFVARIVEQSIAEVDPDLIEAAESFGSSNWQIVYKVMLKESLPSLVRGVAITFVNLFGYAAMAGTVGAGGLGDLAIRYGYQRFNGEVMIAAVVVCVIVVQVFQTAGDVIARQIDHRRRA